MKQLVLSVVLLAAALSARAGGPLTIAKAGPVGEVATLAEANEVRVVFSEPMVSVGKVPKELAVPWFHIVQSLAGAAPAQVDGSLRWSGTTTLIFTPKKPLPYATKFDVTIDAAAAALNGDTLGKPYHFSFTTPTVQLRRVSWYRREGAPGAPVVVLLTFNQPVDPAVVAAHLQLRTVAHELKIAPPPAPERLAPADLQSFEAKKARALEAAGTADALVLASVTKDWNRKQYPPSDRLVVLETRPGVQPGTHLRVVLDKELARPGSVRTGRQQEFTVELPPPFFVAGIGCTAECDPDAAVSIEFTSPLLAAPLKKALTITDVTDAAHPQPVAPKAPPRDYDFETTTHSLDELGYALEPARKYVVRIDAALTAANGEPLGYSWAAVVTNWHRSAFTSFGDGNGVWESSGGSVLPFYARNFRNVKQWLVAIRPDELVPTLAMLEKGAYKQLPPGAPQTRALAPASDKTQSYGLDVRSALGPSGKGLVWVAVQNGDPIAQSRVFPETDIHATLVQVTNLGISVKDSPQNTLVFVTRLDDGSPVAGANVAIRTLDNKVFWSGTTGANGIAVAPRTDLRRSKEKKAPAEGGEEFEGDNSWEAIETLHFVATAEKDGDFAYAASNWNEGINPWTFDLPFDLAESEPLLRGSIFTDRGVYKPGEELHAKIVLRRDTPAGMQLFAAGTKVTVALTDSHDREIDKRTLPLTEWSSAEWTFTIPQDAFLGTYRFDASVENIRERISGDFLVAAYRRPEFRVDVTLAGAGAIAGAKLDGTIAARYLFGAPMSRRPVRWTYSKTPLFDVPAAIADRFAGQYTFLGYDEKRERGTAKISSKETKLDAAGDLKLALDTQRDAGWPYDYRLEGEVTDVSRQKIAGRNSVRVDPAPWYVGVRTPPFFADAAKGIDTDLIAVALDGTVTPGVAVNVELKQVQWNSVRRAEGNGFYTWDTERKEVDAGKWTVTTAAAPAVLHVPLASGGEYVLTATARDSDGRSTTTRLSFYAVGSGYTAWERYDHNRIDLVPEKKTLRPGESARIMVKSPWERATALVTTERESVRTWREFELTSTQQTITVPIADADIPNVYVSVLLVKGRTKEAVTEDASDPGKPSFRLGYTELKVDDASKRLRVDVKANRDEYRPAAKARVDVDVRDSSGNGARSEVTLWAVDYGVLSLTGYSTPDIAGAVYADKALQVVTDDSREKIISRRVLTPKGAGEGGGGGRDAGPGTLRKDFRVLAFWLGSLTTDRRGHARADVTLPESLTTYRIMAVAADALSRFGSGRSEVRVNKALLITPAFPRFLAVGDKAHFGGVVHSQLKQRGTAAVTIRSLDPALLEITSSPSASAAVDAGGSAEIRFDAVAKSPGTARVRMSVSMNGESDAFEETIPIRVLVSPETTAAYGSVAGDASTAPEALELPADVVPSFGGLRIELAPTQLVGLGEGARYLVEYPYGCAEQRASAGLALMLATDLGDAFRLPGIDAGASKVRAQENVNKLTGFQCEDGGFAFWPGECTSESPYLTSWVVHVLQRAAKLGYRTDAGVLERAYAYLEKELGTKRPSNEGWWPAYTAWQAFAVKTLVEGGRNEDSHLTRLMSYTDRMPLFGIAYLADALVAKGERGARFDDVHRRLANATLDEGGTAHVEELADPELLWFWNSNVRSTAIVLGTLVRAGGDQETVARLVRWIMNVRKAGRWGNTQENAWAMEALVDYYRRYEAAPPEFDAMASAGGQKLAGAAFHGRTTSASMHEVAMPELLRVAPPGAKTPVVFAKQGSGTLFYAMQLRYARSVTALGALDQGFALERRYALESGKNAQTSFAAGDLIRVTLRIRNTKERRFVAVTDPIPAGTEPVESWFATTATELAEAQAKADRGGDDWMSWWRRGGFDHVERHDDRVDLFATRLGEGTHEFTYLLRATTAGAFAAAPMHAEEMYEPEVFGRTATAEVEVRP